MEETSWKILPESHCNEILENAINFNQFVWIVHTEFNNGDLSVDISSRDRNHQAFLRNIDMYEDFEKYSSNSIFVIKKAQIL